MNAAISSISSIPFLTKRGTFFPYDTTTSSITSILSKEVCKNVRVELQLQQLTGEYLQHSTAAGNEVRLGVSARGFWQAGQMAFLDITVFSPNTTR